MIMKEYLKRASNDKMSESINEAGKDKKSVMGVLDKEKKKLHSIIGKLRSVKKSVKSDDIETAIENTIVTLTNTFDEFLSDMDMYIDEL